MEAVDDPRKSKDYSIKEIIHGAINLVLFKCGPRNAYDNPIDEGKFRKNHKKMFGLRIPKLDTVADVLKLHFGSTVILMETFVVREGRPKSGVGRRGFLNKQLFGL